MNIMLVVFSVFVWSAATLNQKDMTISPKFDSPYHLYPSHLTVVPWNLTYKGILDLGLKKQELEGCQWIARTQEGGERTFQSFASASMGSSFCGINEPEKHLFPQSSMGPDGITCVFKFNEQINCTG